MEEFFENYQTIKRYYAEDKNGKHLFFIEIIQSIKGATYFATSLQTDLMTIPDLRILASDILRFDAVCDAMDEIGYRIIDEIKQIPELKKEYFKEYFLDKEGKFSIDAFNQAYSIASNSIPQLLTPYSIHCNPIIFDLLKQNILNDKEEFFKTTMSMEGFENNLVTDNLQDAYINVLNNDCQYFKYLTKENNIWSLFLVRDNELVFFFLVED